MGARPTSEVGSPTCWFADREVLEKIVGHQIPDDIWEFVPWGHRLVVPDADREARRTAIVQNA